MEPLLEQSTAWLLEAGPWIVFVVTLVETAVFVGLLVPAEATVLFAAVMAERGVFSLESVLAATFLGALAGDQVGYFLGRFAGTRMAADSGRLGRLWARAEGRTRGLFQRHSALSVSGARFISFVRTLMPWFAGMSRMAWGRFFFFDLLGVAGWAGASVALGYIAGESWGLMAGALGTASALIVLALVLLAVGGTAWRRSSRTSAGSAAPGDDSWSGLD